MAFIGNKVLNSVCRGEKCVWEIGFKRFDDSGLLILHEEELYILFKSVVLTGLCRIMLVTPLKQLHQQDTSVALLKQGTWRNVSSSPISQLMSSEDFTGHNYSLPSLET